MVMSDRIALLRSGELEQVATPREIYGYPATAYAAQFIGHTNLLKGDVREGVVSCGALKWAAPLPDGSVWFSLRPENVRLATSGDPPRGAARVSGKVQHRAFHGSTELIRVACGGGLILTARIANSNQALEEVALEFFPADAVAVRESVERV